MYKLSYNMSTEKLTYTICQLRSLELRFGAVALAEKLVFDKIYEKISIAGSHFGTHG